MRNREGSMDSMGLEGGRVKCPGHKPGREIELCMCSGDSKGCSKQRPYSDFLTDSSGIDIFNKNQEVNPHVRPPPMEEIFPKAMTPGGREGGFCHRELQAEAQGLR